jgi:hypothetical protein
MNAPELAKTQSDLAAAEAALEAARAAWRTKPDDDTRAAHDAAASALAEARARETAARQAAREASTHERLGAVANARARLAELAAAPPVQILEDEDEAAIVAAVAGLVDELSRIGRRVDARAAEAFARDLERVQLTATLRGAPGPYGAPASPAPERARAAWGRLGRLARTAALELGQRAGLVPIVGELVALQGVDGRDTARAKELLDAQGRRR